MQVMKYNKIIFSWLCLCPDGNESSILIRLSKILTCGGVLAIEFLTFISSILFIIYNLQVNIEACLYALFQVAALFSVLYMWVVAFILRNNVAETFWKFQKIHDLSNFFHLTIF